MLFEPTGQLWRSNGIMVNSSLMLFSHDLSQQSNVLFFNGDDRDLIVEFATQEPWSAPSIAR